MTREQAAIYDERERAELIAFVETLEKALRAALEAVQAATEARLGVEGYTYAIEVIDAALKKKR